jgi:hypothetical protein
MKGSVLLPAREFLVFQPGMSKTESVRSLAEKGRMARHIVTEGLLLAGAGGTLGWWITKWAVRTWAVATASPYQVVDYSVNSGTLAYLVTTSVAVAILVSFGPIAKVYEWE